MAWTEDNSKRGPTSRTYTDTTNPAKRMLSTTLAPLHYQSMPDSGIYDTPVNFTAERIDNAVFDGWRVTAADWHYALGKPLTGLLANLDGVIGFGGRQGAHWFKYRLLRVGYLHTTTRTWYDIGGAPTYARANLTYTPQTMTIGPNGDSVIVGGSATWNNIWTTPGGGTVTLRLRLDGNRLKEDVILNAAARSWIAANRPPGYFGIPPGEAAFGFVFRLDWSDIPRRVLNGVDKQISDDYEADGDKLELRDALGRLLSFMPIGTVTAGAGDTQQTVALKRRFYQASADVHYLAVGLLATNLAGLPAGDLTFDPTLNLSVAAGTDDALKSDGGYSDNDAAISFGGLGGVVTDGGQGYRFLNVTIPNGSTVSSAILKLKKSGTHWNEIAVRLTAIDEDNTATFSSGSPPGARAITSSYIAVQTTNFNMTDGTVYDWPNTSGHHRSSGVSF